MKLGPLVFVTLFATLVVAVAAAVEERSRLIDLPKVEYRRALREIWRSRDRNIEELMEVVRGSTQTDKRGTVHLLGRLRATEAICLLTRGIAYVPANVVWMNDEDVGNEAQYYCCAEALTGIGHLAIGSMEGLILHSEEVTERTLAAWVIMRVEGMEAAASRLSKLAGSEDEAHARALAECDLTEGPLPVNLTRPRCEAAVKYIREWNINNTIAAPDFKVGRQVRWAK